MSFLLRCIVLVFASFGMATVLVSMVVGLTWWLRARSRAPEGTAAMRADAFLRLRILPVTIAVATGAFTAVGLWRFEAREVHEVIGWTIRGGATVGALILTTFVTRLWRMHLETRGLLSTWLEGAAPLSLTPVPGQSALNVLAFRIDTGFPLVAVVGILRPTLVVDGSVLDACSQDELSAILAHEQGHLRRWDNLRRAVFAATPDLLARTSIGPTLRDAWREATEEAADDMAGESSGEARARLADALLRVARTAHHSASSSPERFRSIQLPASALYRGDSVERRVRRLIAPAESCPPTGPRWGLLVTAFVVTIAIAYQREIHTVVEVAVNGLW